jgi:hypothetical protein
MRLVAYPMVNARSSNSSKRPQILLQRNIMRGEFCGVMEYFEGCGDRAT